MSQSNRSRSKGSRRARQQQLEVVHPNAGGIDIGSRSHYVAVPASRDPQPVRSFGCTTPDLEQMVLWLKACNVTSVAMESTSVYWVCPAQVLEEAGIDVYLVDARHAKSIPGRKTDVQDCQWLQQLHSFGLLSRAFLPDKSIRPIRSLWRHRRELIQHGAEAIQIMQKSLEQMNLQLHKVISDISGVTGMRILRAILEGKQDPQYLVTLVHPTCKRPAEDFVKALTGHYKADQLFILGQSMETYDFLHRQLLACEEQIQGMLRALPQKADSDAIARVPARTRPRKSLRNQPNFDLRTDLFAMTGVDLTQIDGIDAVTAFTVISEQGIDMSRFPTEKHFASHLGLCPNHKITGGRIRKRATRKVSSRAAVALRVAAQSLRNSQSPNGARYRMLHGRLGPQKTITAMAHHLAKLIYRLLKNGEQYLKKTIEEYQEKHRAQQLKYLASKARKLGIELLDPDTGEVFS